MSRELNPLVVRELRGGLRTGRRVAMMTFFLSIVAIIFLSVFETTAATLATTGVSNGSAVGAIFFPTTVGVELFFLCLIAPAQTAGALVSERERQTYDLLVVTPLSPWQIVLGKLVSSLAYTALLLVAALPIQSLAFLMGGVGIEEVGLAALLLLATLVLFGSMGLWASAVFPGIRAASAFAYVLSGSLTLGLPLIALFASPLSLAFATSFPTVLDAPPPWLLYTGELLAATNPWLTAGLTEAQLQSGSSLLWVHQAFGKTHADLPGPWLIFLALYALGTLLFLWLTARRVRKARAG